MNKVYFGFYANLCFLAKLSWFKIYIKLGTICVDLGSFWGLLSFFKDWIIEHKQSLNLKLCLRTILN